MASDTEFPFPEVLSFPFQMHLFKLNWVNIQKENREQTVQVVYRWVSHWEGVRQRLKSGKHQEPVCKARNQAQAGPHASSHGRPQVVQRPGTLESAQHHLQGPPFDPPSCPGGSPSFPEHDFPKMRTPRRAARGPLLVCLPLVGPRPRE